MFKKKFPVCYQLDSFDCGPACLEMIARYHGRTLPKQFLRQLCQQDRLGSSLAGIAHAAEKIGFRTLAVKVSFQELAEKALLPCIAYWPQGHFVVVHRVRKDRVYIADPSAGLMTYSRSEFEACWRAETSSGNWGILLLLEPTPEFHAQELGAPRLSTVNVWRPLLRDMRRHFAPVGVAIAVSLFVQLLLPFLSAAVVDMGIANRSLSVVMVILLAQLALTTSRLGVNLLQSWIMSYVGARLDRKLVAQFLSKLTRLSMSFFDGKLVGDLMQRINDHKYMQQFFTNNIWQVFTALLSLLVFGAALAIFWPTLFGVFFAGSLAYLVYSAVFIKHQRLISHKNFRLSAQKQGLIVEFLAGMQEIKLNNAEQPRRWQWEIAQHELARLQIKAELLNHVQSSGGMLINEAKNMVLTLLVAGQVINGHMSLGAMVAVQYIIGQLSWPLNQLTMMLIQGQEALLSYQRAREVELLQDEEHPVLEPPPESCATIEFKNVIFNYGGTADHRLFNDLSLLIPRGKTTAIVGRSGSGKTSLLKLILKFYPVLGGQITIDGNDINNISHSALRKSCGIVMQDGYIFSDSVMSNIAVGEREIDMKRVEEVARIAQIHSFIESLPLGYETRIGRDGIGLSRGQSQRILIARALYRNPRYLLFDEATSALDAETESVLVNELRTIMQGKTSVVIAHRMSTVRHADQIIVLDQGRVVESGTHEELVGCRGSYFNLVKNQLELGE